MDVPVYKPTEEIVAKANITQVMLEKGVMSVSLLHAWSVSDREEFWRYTINKLGIHFKTLPHRICDTSSGIETPEWLTSAKMNIVDSCFGAEPNETALLYQSNNRIHSVSYQELQQLVNRIANSLKQQGYQAGDAIAIIMPMHMLAVASYLAIIKLGGSVVSIADSFASEEIALRLAITKAKAVITQYTIAWGTKQLPLYEKIIAARAPACIVIMDESTEGLRDIDVAWNAFITDCSEFSSVICDPMMPSNILFSSGTTGEPKAIAWNHTTPIKAASDAFYHQNIQPGDVLAWPTNLGWMMGPWLIFAALINRASIALYPDSPKERPFGEFIQNTKVTMLGVVPTLVSQWKQTQCMEGLNWQHIKVFSSTGECSNPTDMLYLMQLAGNKPVIEYCGGTEIGGAYLSSTVVENNYPSLFSTPTMGTEIVILDDEGQLANVGEIAIVPPVLGLSTKLLNADHHAIYYANMPKFSDGKILRRHGDRIEKLANGYYRLLGRNDDTMKLGGIKTSAVEIERILAGVAEEISETAAIAVTPKDNGPSQLVIFAVTSAEVDNSALQQLFQQQINQRLNPLFKIHQVILVNDLPKTPSNKIMRRKLRESWEKNEWH